MDDLTDTAGQESQAGRDDWLRHGSSFGTAAAAYAEHRPDYAEAAVRWALQLPGGDPAGSSRTGPPRRVLDLAAGTGKLTAALAGLGAEVTAVEPDPAMLAELRRGLPSVRALPGRAEEIPLPDGSVDAVLAGQAMHWFDLDRAVPEIARVLAPGGVLAGLWNVDDDRVDWVAALAADQQGQVEHHAAALAGGNRAVPAGAPGRGRSRPVRGPGDRRVRARAAADGRPAGRDGRDALQLPGDGRARPIAAAGTGPGSAARPAGDRGGRVRAADGHGRAAGQAVVMAALS